MVDHSHDPPVETRNDCFQTVFVLKVNFNTVLCRESNSITSFSFGSSIPLVGHTQNTMM